MVTTGYKSGCIPGPWGRAAAILQGRRAGGVRAQKMQMLYDLTHLDPLNDQLEQCCFIEQVKSSWNP